MKNVVGEEYAGSVLYMQCNIFSFLQNAFILFYFIQNTNLAGRYWYEFGEENYFQYSIWSSAFMMIDVLTEEWLM